MVMYIHAIYDTAFILIKSATFLQLHGINIDFILQRKQSPLALS